MELYKGTAPIVIVPTTYPTLDVEQIRDFGIQMVIYANHGLRSSIKAMKETFDRILREGNTAGVELDISTMQEVFELQGMFEMRQREDRYSSTGSVILNN